MRLWADVFDTNDAKIGTVTKLNSAAVTKALDGAGSVSLSFPATDEATFSLLQNERRVRLYVEEDEQPRLLGKGIIREITLDEGSARATASGPDSLDALTRKSVLLGRSYNNLPVSTIAASLVGLVEGWSATVTATGNQSARFDGVNVLAALIRLAEEKGLHVRESLDPNTIELGPFGDDNGIVALKPLSLTSELAGRDDVLIISQLKRKSSSKKVVNWIVPVGAGEGTAALTLKDSSYSIPSLTGPDGRTLYYLKDDDSISDYGQIEKVVTFKEITPVANNAQAKQYAADALRDAGLAWLTKNSQPFETYTLSAKKVRRAIRPGDKLTVRYKGFVETESGQFTYLDVNDQFWVNKVTENVSEAGVTLNLDISTIDRPRLEAEGTAGQVVSLIESTDVRNLSVQTYPISWALVYYDTLGYTDSVKAAEFALPITSDITNVTRVVINFKTKPLWTPVVVYDLAPLQMTWHMRQGYNHPSDVTLEVNGVDVSSQFGGPWAVGVNSAIDVQADITSLILSAAGGLYQTHTIVLKCASRIGEVRVTTSHPSVVNAEASSGMVEMKINVLAVAQGIVS